MATWPTTADEPIQLQQALGNMTPGRWQPPTTMQRIGACFERTKGLVPRVTRGSPGRR